MRHIAFTTAGALFAATSITYGLHRAANLIAPSDPPPTKVAVLPEASSPVKVEIDNFAFKPNELTIAVGASVNWVNRDDVPHTATSKGATPAFDSKALDTDDSYSFKFTNPGVYHYYCKVHPHMTGTITVK